MSSTECPRCGGKAIPIVYGMPGPKLFERSKRGEVRLGGCVVMGDGNDPTHYCPACDTATVAETFGAGDEVRGKEQPVDPERDWARRFTWEEGDIVWEQDIEPDGEKQG